MYVPAHFSNIIRAMLLLGLYEDNNEVLNDVVVNDDVADLDEFNSVQLKLVNGLVA